MDKYIIKHSHITSKSEQLLKTILENEIKMFENFYFVNPAPGHIINRIRQ